MPSAIAMAVGFWPFGEIACRINAVFNYMCACSSSHTAAMISFDRTIAVVYPLKYKSMMTAKIMISICVWILFNTGSCAIFVGATPWISYDYNEAVCAVTYSEYLSKVFIYCGCAFCYYIPALIIGTCNAIILMQIRRSSKVMSEHITTIKLLVFEQNMKKRKDMEMRKSIYSMMAIVIVYFFSLTPYSINKQGKAMTGIDAPPWLNYTITILMFISSATNPFIYGILRKDYRDGFKKIPRLFREKYYYYCF
ncbi:mu-type opioid receptor-like [Parasteatoda tepidariorum]|uniref:mu-type opioid receptor-like n=1 Tax=Parasteatoda tepidariorum TaxID=114398 RepID=UPI001C7190E2|nr:mu-type opioid receptor-like [Parasteatoda tepidariorum]